MFNRRFIHRQTLNIETTKTFKQTLHKGYGRLAMENKDAGVFIEKRAGEHLGKDELHRCHTDEDTDHRGWTRAELGSKILSVSPLY